MLQCSCESGWMNNLDGQRVVTSEQKTKNDKNELNPVLSYLDSIARQRGRVEQKSKQVSVIDSA